MAPRGIFLCPAELDVLGVRDAAVGVRFTTSALERRKATYEIVHVDAKGIIVQRI